MPLPAPTTSQLSHNAHLDPYYAQLLVLIELFGSASGTLWWVAADSIAMHEELLVRLRQIKLNHSTKRLKSTKKLIFTTYFQELPDTFTTFRPDRPEVAEAVLEIWRKYTQPDSTKIITRTKGQMLTISECLRVCGITFRIIERPVMWRNAIREGYYFDLDADFIAIWREDKKKAQVGGMYRALVS